MINIFSIIIMRLTTYHDCVTICFGIGAGIVLIGFIVSIIINKVKDKKEK